MIFVMLVQSGRNLILFTQYQINKETIASSFCENKAKPVMQCEGKCYLAKKIQAQEEKEKQFPGIFKGMEDILLFFSFELVSLELLPGSATDNHFASIFQPVFSAPLKGIFQPPR